MARAGQARPAANNGHGHRASPRRPAARGKKDREASLFAPYKVSLYKLKNVLDFLNILCFLFFFFHTLNYFKID